MRLTMGALVALVGLTLVGCQDLPDVIEGICGNGVIEPGEDCESSTLDDNGEVVGQCADVTGDNACHFEWSETVGCPPGYGAGADQRCRQASGSFTSGASLTLVVDDIKVGDVDGDLFDDVVTASGTSIQVSFGSTQADLAANVVTQVSTSGSALEIGDLNADGFADVMVATEPGVQTFLGSDDRTLDPFSYPQASFTPETNFVFGVADDIDPSTPAEEVLVAWSDQIGFPVAQGAGASAVRALPDPPGVIGGVADRLAGPLATARLAQSRSVPGDVDPTLEVALGYPTTSKIFLFQASAGPLTMSDTGVILDTGDPALTPLRGASGLFFGYFNGDGCLDLIAHVGIGTPKLIVYLGTPAALDCTGALQTTPMDLVTLPDTSIRILAVADLDADDSVTDLVTSRGLFRITGTGPWNLMQISANTTPYEDALVVDINGDGALDIAGFHESLPDVEVLINASTPGDPVFNRFVVPTGDAVLRLAAGDFDGDLTDDVAIVEVDSETSGLTVSVSFGAFHGPPSARVIMDRFPVLAGFVAAGVVGSSGFPDAVDDLIVLEDDEDAAAVAVTILFGSGARAMTAPLVLTKVDGAELTLEAPVALVLGEFEGTADLDLFTVGFGADDLSDAYLLAGDGTGGLTETEQATWPRTFESADAVWAAADVDGDGQQEIAAGEQFSRRIEPGDTKIAFFPADPVQAGQLDDLLLDTIDGVLGTHALAFADLDGDDDLDLLIAFDTKIVDRDQDSIYVAWNSGDALQAPRVLVGSEGCIDAVPVSLDGDGPPELVALCRVSEKPTDPFDLRRFDAAEPETLIKTDEPITRVSAARTTKLRVGDINGDGLGDLVVSTRGGEAADVRILLQHDVHDQD